MWDFVLAGYLKLASGLWITVKCQTLFITGTECKGTETEPGSESSAGNNRHRSNSNQLCTNWPAKQSWSTWSRWWSCKYSKVLSGAKYKFHNLYHVFTMYCDISCPAAAQKVQFCCICINIILIIIIFTNSHHNNGKKRKKTYRNRM